MQQKALLFCLILSGFSGLAYELIWVRLLSFAFGSTTESFATVIAVFFGGLAIGSWIMAKFLVRVKRPVRFYAILELLTGMFGIGLYPFLNRLSQYFADIDPGLGLRGILVRTACSGLFLLIPTILMGMTLPVVTKALVQRDEDIGRGTGLIYGFNTFGAFLGSYFITYHSLYWFGVFGSNILTAIVNVAVGIIAFRLDGYFTSSYSLLKAWQNSSNRAAEKYSPVLRYCLILTFLSGFSFIALEVIWVRIISTLLQGTVYGVGSVLMTVLVAIAMGSWLSAHIFKKNLNLLVCFSVAQILAIIFVIIILARLDFFAYFLFTLTELEFGIDPIYLQLLGVFIILCWPFICSGLSLPLLVKTIQSKAEHTGATLGKLYAFNTAGSIIGSLVTGFYLLPVLGSETTIFVALIMIALMGSLSAVIYIKEFKHWVGTILIALNLIFALLFTGYNREHAFLQNATNGLSYARLKKSLTQAKEKLLYFAEGKSSTVAVAASKLKVALSINGLGQGGRNLLPPHHMLESLLVSYIPLAHAKTQGNVLLVGLGAGISVDVFHQFGIDKVNVIELEEKVINAVEVIFEQNSPIKPDRDRIILNDARQFLLTNAKNTDERFNIITSMPAHPWVAANLFTKEFFQLAKANLAEDGVFTTWFGVGKMDDLAIKSLLQAFTEVFDDYIVYAFEEVAAYFLVGGRSLKFDQNKITALPAHQLLKDYYQFSDPYYLAANIIASGSQHTSKPAFDIVNTDDSAFIELHAPKRKAAFQNWTLNDYFPKRFLLPELIKSDKPADAIKQTLESMLETPNSQVRNGPKGKARAVQAKHLLEGTKHLLTDEEYSYFAGRIALAEEKFDDAEHFFALIKDHSALKAKADKFYAISQPDRTRRLALLLRLPFEPDVAIEIADEDLKYLKIPLIKQPNITDQFVQWLLWAYGQGNQLTVNEGQYDTLINHAMRFIQETVHPGIIKLVKFILAKRHDTRLSAIVSAREQEIFHWHYQQNKFKAEQYYNDKKYLKALTYFDKANHYYPNDIDMWLKMLHCYVELNNRDGIEKVQDMMKLLGKDSNWQNAAASYLRKVVSHNQPVHLLRD